MSLKTVFAFLTFFTFTQLEQNFAAGNPFIAYPYFKQLPEESIVSPMNEKTITVNSLDYNSFITTSLYGKSTPQKPVDGKLTDYKLDNDKYVSNELSTTVKYHDAMEALVNPFVNKTISAGNPHDQSSSSDFVPVTQKPFNGKPTDDKLTDDKYASDKIFPTIKFTDVIKALFNPFVKETIFHEVSPTIANVDYKSVTQNPDNDKTTEYKLGEYKYVPDKPSPAVEISDVMKALLNPAVNEEIYACTSYDEVPAIVPPVDYIPVAQKSFNGKPPEDKLADDKYASEKLSDDDKFFEVMEALLNPFENETISAGSSHDEIPTINASVGYKLVDQNLSNGKKTEDKLSQDKSTSGKYAAAVKFSDSIEPLLNPNVNKKIFVDNIYDEVLGNFTSADYEPEAQKPDNTKPKEDKLTDDKPASYKPFFVKCSDHWEALLNPTDEPAALLRVSVDSTTDDGTSTSKKVDAQKVDNKT